MTLLFQLLSLFYHLTFHCSSLLLSALRLLLASFGTNYVHAFTPSELLSCYSAPSILLDALPCSATPSTYAKHLATCRPFQLGAHFVNYIIDTHLFIFIDAATSPTEFVTSSLVNTVFQLVPFLLLLTGYAAGY